MPAALLHLDPIRMMAHAALFGLVVIVVLWLILRRRAR